MLRIQVLAQIFQMLWVLCVQLPAPTAVLVQNPPAIPALMVVWLVRFLRGVCASPPLKPLTLPAGFASVRCSALSCCCLGSLQDRAKYDGYVWFWICGLRLWPGADAVPRRRPIRPPA